MLSSRIRVIVADDHPVVADGIQLRLDTNLMIDIVGVATSFADTIELLKTTPADVLILDLTGMQGSPIAMAEHVRHNYPKLAIVVFSSMISMARDLLAVGALGYVLKEDLASHLAYAIHAAHQGHIYLSPIVRDYLDGYGRTAELQQLAPRELAVLECLGQGLGTLDISQQLGIDARTVQNYITVLNRKVGVSSRYQLVEWYRYAQKQRHQ